MTVKYAHRSPSKRTKQKGSAFFNQIFPFLPAITAQENRVTKSLHIPIDKIVTNTTFYAIICVKSTVWEFDMRKFFSEFKTFISKGNVMDLAVGVIVGGMFTKIVNSFTNDIIMPFVSLITGKTSFENMFWIIKGGEEGVVYNTLEEAKAAGVTLVAYGNLIELVLDFLITAFCLFLIVKGINKLNSLKPKKADAEEAKEE